MVVLCIFFININFFINSYRLSKKYSKIIILIFLLMNNVFAMATLKSSNFYTGYVLQSFFRYSKMDNDDEFLLIDIDNDAN